MIGSIIAAARVATAETPAELDAAEQAAAREWVDAAARRDGDAWLRQHPSGKDWAACKCGTPNCWAQAPA